MRAVLQSNTNYTIYTFYSCSGAGSTELNLMISSADNELVKLHEFYHYPFLKNESFKLFLKQLNLKASITPDKLKSFILKAQVAFYISFVDSQFEATSLRAPNKAKISKCPFAPKINEKRDVPFACLNILNEISADILTIDSFKVILTETVNTQVFNNENGLCYVIPSNFKFIASNFTTNSFGETFQELFKTKQTFYASDLLFLMPNSVFVIDPLVIEIFLNFISYFDILNLEKSFENLKAVGLASKNLSPSQLEPYADVLSVDYIQSNSDFFK